MLGRTGAQKPPHIAELLVLLGAHGQDESALGPLPHVRILLHAVGSWSSVELFCARSQADTGPKPGARCQKNLHALLGDGLHRRLELGFTDKQLIPFRALRMLPCFWIH